MSRRSYLITQRNCFKRHLKSSYDGVKGLQKLSLCAVLYRAKPWHLSGILAGLQHILVIC